MEVEVTEYERTFAMGLNRFRVNTAGEWTALLFGTTPYNTYPHYFWSSIKKGQIPQAVLEKAGKED